MKMNAHIDYKVTNERYCLKGQLRTTNFVFVRALYEGQKGAKFACQCQGQPTVMSRNAMSPMWKNIYSCYLMHCIIQQIKGRHTNLHHNLQI